MEDQGKQMGTFLQRKQENNKDEETIDGSDFAGKCTLGGQNHGTYQKKSKGQAKGCCAADYVLFHQGAQKKKTGFQGSSLLFFQYMKKSGE